MSLSFWPKRLNRYRSIARLFFKYGRTGFRRIRKLRGLVEQGDQKVEAPNADSLAGDLESMGPTYVKLGQFLSTRADLLPRPYLDVLVRLQDHVEPFSSEEAERIVAEEIGVRLSKAFLEFDSKPMAAASLAQVHRARLRDGREVVVKVQRPGIRTRMVEDLQALMELAEFIDHHTRVGKRFEFLGIVEELRKSLLRELDFRQEARNYSILREHLADFPNLVVPRPVDDYTTAHILTMDYIEGRKITDISHAARTELDGAALADELFRAYLKQILVDGFWHADPHPGNVLLTPDHKLGIVDLGMVGRMREDMQEKVLEMMLAISEGRGQEAAEFTLALVDEKKDADRDGFVREVADLVAQNKDLPVGQLEMGKIVLSVLSISGDFGIRLPPEFTILEKTLLNLDQVIRILDPAFNPNEAIRRNLLDLMRRRTSQAVSPSTLVNAWIDAKGMLQRTPKRIARIIERLAENDLEIRVRAIDEHQLTGGLQKIGNRVTLGLVLAALIVGASLLMRVETSFRILGYPGLAILFWLTAAGGSLLLALNILVRDEKSGPRRRA